MQIEVDDRGRPAAIVSGRRRARVVSLVDAWEVVEEWWRPAPIARRYYRAAVEGGEVVTVFRDMIGGAWYRQRE